MKWLLSIACILLPLTTNAALCGGLNPVLVTTDAVNFGNYDAVAGSANTANGDVNIYCTVQTGNTLPSFTVALSNGNSGSFAPRRMNFLTSALNYNLYLDNAYSIVWGDGTAGTQMQSYSASSNVATKTFPIFGNMPAHQYVSIGTYNDLVTVTVTY